MSGLRVLLDCKTYAGHPGRVDIPENLQRVDWKARYGLDLAAAMPVEHAVGLTDETGIRQLVDAVVEAAVRLFVHLECDFPQRPALIAAQCGQVLDRQARLGNDEQHTRQAAGLMERLDNQ